MLGGVAVVAYSALLVAAVAAAGNQHFQDLHNAIEKQRRLKAIKKYIRSQVPGFRIPIVGDVETPSKPKEEPISIVLGTPASPERDGCLNFPIGSKLSQKGNVKPVKMELYVHVKLVAKKKRKSRNTGRTEKRKKKKSKKRNRKSNKGRRKPKKKRKGRKIELSVTNGVKRLAKLRRRVYETYWFGIELPISQFLNEISHQDIFKLCITCKRCKKRVLLDLYKEDHQQIPFIEIKKINLPRRRPRSKRSSGVLQSGGKLIPSTNSSRSASSQCCVEEVHTEDVNIPYLLHPSTFAMSFCETSHNTDSAVSSSNTFNKLLSKDTTGTIQRKCVPASYESFTYSFLDRDLRIKYAAIPNLLPSGCKKYHQRVKKFGSR